MTRAALDRGKLAAVLGMLGSAADGERAAAGLLATRMLKAAGTTWAQVLATPAPQPQATPHQPHGPAKYSGHHRAALDTCTRLQAHLTAWERQFLDGIARRRSLTERQVDVLLRIADELPARAGR